MITQKILVSDTLEQEGLEILSSQAELTYEPEITPESLVEEISVYDALIVRSRTKVSSSVIASAERLKVIGRAGVGVDNIDLNAAAARGITVVNTPTATSTAVAEHTLGLILSLSRRFPEADASMKVGRWEKKRFKGAELSGKTLGVLGLGNIGSLVAQYGRALGMKTFAFDPRLTSEQIKDRGAEPVSYNQLLAVSDYLTLHLPLTQDTLNSFSTTQFAQMKSGAYLVCTARGGLIDEDALAMALDSGQLAGAALDVFAKEPPPEGSIAQHPLVIATPHIASQTVEAQIRAATSVAEEVLSVLMGNNPRWEVG